MKGKVYVVYIHTEKERPGQFGDCYAMAFIEDNNPDGFSVVSNHLSSNYGWAWKDIRRESHMREFSEFFPEGFEIVDVGQFYGDDHDQVIAALKKMRDVVKGTNR